jgi:hypothetical protein
MRITAELINKSPQFFNPLHERELDLRGIVKERKKKAHCAVLTRYRCAGYRIAVIENLGITEVRKRRRKIKSN